MTLCRRSIFAAAFGAILTLPAAAHEVADPTIRHDAHDGVVRLYGAGGPDTAFKKVAAVFTAETGIKVEVTRNGALGGFAVRGLCRHGGPPWAEGAGWGGSFGTAARSAARSDHQGRGGGLAEGHARRETGPHHAGAGGGTV